MSRRIYLRHGQERRLIGAAVGCLAIIALAAGPSLASTTRPATFHPLSPEFAGRMRLLRLEALGSSPAVVAEFAALEEDTMDEADPGQADDPSGSPEASDQPEASRTPEASDAPEATDAPEASDLPEASRPPKASHAPEATEPPEATDAPEASDGDQSGDQGQPGTVAVTAATEATHFCSGRRFASAGPNEAVVGHEDAGPLPSCAIEPPG